MSQADVTGSPVVGIIGASGAVGTASAHMLAAGPGARPSLRLGGRRLDVLRKAAERLRNGDGPAVEVSAIDLDDPGALQGFCRGCTVVLSCAGPSYRIGDRLARAALRQGADFVDVAGYDPVHEQLAALDLAAQGRSAVLCAGVHPGLSTLIPLWLAGQGVGQPVRLTAHVGGAENTTRGSAADMVLSVGDDTGPGSSATSLAAWRDGRPRQRALRILGDVELPFFPHRVTAQPMLSAESQRLAVALGLDELDWYNVFVGSRLLSALNELRAAPPVDARQLELAAGAVMRACDIDLGGRAPYYVLAYQMEGRSAGRPTSRSAVLRTTNSFDVSGAMGALAVRALLDKTIAPGVHYAAEALDPTTTIELIRGLDVVTALEAIETTPTAVPAFETGAL